MRNREPVPDRSFGGDNPEREPLGQLPGSEQGLWSEPRLTIAEAARLCGVSASTIRRYLADGRFPGAHQQPSPIPGQRGLWRIPTQDLLAAGLRSRQTAHPNNSSTSPPGAEGQPSLLLTGFENSSMPWRLSGPAAEPPRAWPRAAHTIQTLKGALRALQAQHAALGERAETRLVRGIGQSGTALGRIPPAVVVGGGGRARAGGPAGRGSPAASPPGNPGTFYERLARHGHELVADEDFAHCYALGRGRPSIPPR